MEVLKVKRKVRCKECLGEAKFKLVFTKSSILLCENCLKELSRDLSQTTTPMAVVTKFYKKR